MHSVFKVFQITELYSRIEQRNTIFLNGINIKFAIRNGKYEQAYYYYVVCCLKDIK